MKEFSLEEYLKNPNRKIVTRDGKSVRIICTDRRKTIYPIIALCLTDDGSEHCHSYLPNGKEHVGEDSNDDLFFVPEKHEGWVNLYKGNAYYHLGSTIFYQSESEAKKRIVKNCGYVGTIKVEWED